MSVVITLVATPLTSCGKRRSFELKQAYDVYETSAKYGLIQHSENEMQKEIPYFADDLCVTSAKDSKKTPDISSDIASCIGLFDVDDAKVLYSKNVYKKIYPASTTKIMTAYLALKYGKLDDVITISKTAMDIPYDASTCGIHEGDKLTLEQLLYGLLLRSGNEAAIAIAEYISGDVEKFSDLMNQEAVALGATQTHFLNPNGLQDTNHYTTAYDLYLIFNAAVKQEMFVKIINTPTYATTYRKADDTEGKAVWASTNRFLVGTVEIPSNATIIGGKTGTTDAAGHCDVLYSQDENGKYRISVVMGCDTRDNMYVLLSELVAKTEK